ncbi:MAG: glycolate oxidase subunit GlcE [Steroidobacteraceae bacterium]
MTTVSDIQQRVRDAAASTTPLRIVGSGSKDFYGGPLVGEPLSTASLVGIVDYEPAELVMTVQSGTPLADIDAALDARGQMLAFEPPHFGGAGTVGGAVAAGLSGPRRAYAGAARDFVLGVRIIDGQGRLLRFGGQVIKNVAGFDVARLMAGSLGTLGLLTEVTLKTLPKPSTEVTLVRPATEAQALTLCNEWAGRPLPISATCHLDGHLHVLLSGASAAVNAACAQLGGERVRDDAAFWTALRDHSHAVFAPAQTVWRFSVPSATPPLGLGAQQVIEWGGALRWIVGDLQPGARERIAALGGHVSCFRSASRSASAFQALPSALHNLHRRLKHVFDPAAILNRSRLYDL